MQKRGISTVVATVLIILIVVAAVTIIWAAIIPMIKNNLVSSNVCISASLFIDSSSGYTCYDSVKNVTAVMIKRGASDNIAKIKILFSYSGNDYYAVVDSPEKNNAKTFYINATNPDEIKIAPVILVGNSEKECDVVSTLKPVKCNLASYNSLVNLDSRYHGSGASIVAPLNCNENLNCTNWTSQLRCGEGTCKSNETYQTRVCDSACGYSIAKCVYNLTCNCSYGSWQNIGCGLGGCGKNQMFQNRSYAEGCLTGQGYTENCSSNATCELISSAVSYWRLDGNANDWIGRSDGTIYGDVNCSVPGKYGKACSFDGNGDYIISNKSGFGIGGAASKTIAAWVNTLGINRQAIIGVGGDAGTTGYQFVLEHSVNNCPNGYEGRLYFVGYNNDLCTTFSVNDNQWHFIAETYNGNNLTLYGDGYPVASKITSLNTYDGELKIGVQPFFDAGPNWEYLTGSVDEAIMFNRSLSQSEIQLLMNSYPR